jgi:hypothetical protein
MPQSAHVLTFPVDHVVARQHRGATELDNLALSCVRCNAHKGPNLSGIDPHSDRLVRLFHPRRDRWMDHFALHGPFIEGLTDIGRATIEVLTMNDPDYVALRESLLDEGVFPSIP